MIEANQKKNGKISGQSSISCDNLKKEQQNNRKKIFFSNKSDLKRSKSAPPYRHRVQKQSDKIVSLNKLLYIENEGLKNKIKKSDETLMWLIKGSEELRSNIKERDNERRKKIKELEKEIEEKTKQIKEFLGGKEMPGDKKESQNVQWINAFPDPFQLNYKPNNERLSSVSSQTSRRKRRSGKRKKKNKPEIRVRCTICGQKRKSLVEIIPCYHYSCFDCVENKTECPVCSTEIEKFNF